VQLVLALSIAALLLAALGSLALWRRVDDPRLLGVGGALALLAAAGAPLLWSVGSRPLGSDLPSLAACLALGASLLSPLLVRAVERTLRERDRSESLHWRSMEAVRALADWAALSSLGLGARLERLVGIGCEQLDLELGLVALAREDGFEVVGVRAPLELLELECGDRLPADTPWCRMTLDSARPVDLSDVSASGASSGMRAADFAFGSYLGCAVRAGGEAIGLLAFAGSAPRPARFTATEKDLLALMARWLGRELEHRDALALQSRAARPAEMEVAPGVSAPPPAAEVADAARPAPGAATGTGGAAAAGIEAPRAQPPRRPLGAGWKQVRVAPPRPTRAVQRPRVRRRPVQEARRATTGLHRFLLRLEPRLLRVVGDGPALDLRLEGRLEPDLSARIPLDRVVLSLVGTALQALGSGEGRIEISTADLEVGEPAPGVLPAVAPDRYATLVVRAVGAVDPDGLASAFEPAADETALAGRTRLSLSTLYRVLQRAGGDLAVEVERGRSARFTVFLPRAPAAAATQPRVDLAPPPLS
jgi:hypothetical protein